MRKLFTLLMITSCCHANAQIIWNSGTYTFNKTAPFQQDCITSNVCLTRGPMSVIYNEVTENYLDGDGLCNWTPGVLILLPIMSGSVLRNLPAEQQS